MRIRVLLVQVRESLGAPPMKTNLSDTICPVLTVRSYFCPILLLVYNVSLQIGAPIGIAISNIIANGRNAPTAVGAELLVGYKAAFYSFAIMGGVGLLVTVIFAANSDPAKMKTSAGADAQILDEERGKVAVDNLTMLETAQNSEIFETKDGGEIASSAVVQEKTEIK